MSDITSELVNGWPNFALCIYVNNLSIDDCLQFLSETPDVHHFIRVKRGIEDYTGKNVLVGLGDGCLVYEVHNA